VSSNFTSKRNNGVSSVCTQTSSVTLTGLVQSHVCVFRFILH